MKLTRLFVALSTLGALAVASDTAVQAAQPNKSFTVSTTVVPGCKINSVDNITFGNYDPISGGDLTATGEISITCTNKASIQIGLTGGAKFSSGTNNMNGPGTSGTELLAYTIVQPDGSTLWSDSVKADGSLGGTGSVLTVTGAGSATPVVKTMTGKLAASQNVSVGAYSDTVYAFLLF